ncbi:MAG TPA: hypothetical protein PLJ47_15790 [Candidatus Hydrogenedentes bacterium]|nr:hypothetical protein [Candidatus Hydrogenedentota bacterium]HRK36059.1 hypothetical protein [Candidatus Hydrogenedentota bacterium]
MNEHCRKYRDTLHAQFDGGLVMEVAAHEHAAECLECRAYCDQLRTLNSALLALSLEMPRNALVQRVKSSVAAEPLYTNDAHWWLPAAAACTVVLLSGLLLYFAVPVDPARWWDYANQPSTTPSWMLGEISLVEELASLERYWANSSARLDSLSTPLWSGVAGVATLFLVAFNGAKAYSLRTASNQSSYRRTWR